MSIYISSGSYSNLDINEIFKLYNSINFRSIEFSGGKYQKNLKVVLKKNIYNNKLSFHNYFPPPKKSFVINLASDDSIIVNLSVKQLIKSIDLCCEFGINQFSFHAGFLIDPQINQLGKIIKKRNLISKEKGMNNFFKNLDTIINYSKKKNVKLLVENNVISRKNYDYYNKDIFLMTEPDECLKVLKKFEGDLWLLMDVGHFKVSSNTLNFRKKNILKLNNYIKGYHLSDNNGLIDSNNIFTSRAWFWKYLIKNLDYYVIEVYKKDLKIILNCLKILNIKINNAT